MTEKNMQTFWTKYVKEHPPEQSEVWELKIEKGKAMPFMKVATHQIEALLMVQGSGFYHKLTDPPIWSNMQQTRFNVPRPFDCVYLKQIAAFVVVWFYKPNTKKVFIKIPILEFMNEKVLSDRKSLTEQRAKEIGIPIEINVKL